MLVPRLGPGAWRDPLASVLKRHADEIALPPDHAAFANGVKFVEGQFEIQRQQIEVVEFDAGPGIRDVLNTASEDAALSIEEQQRVFRNRRPRDISAFELHWARLADCAQAAIGFRVRRKQTILMIAKSAVWTVSVAA